MKGGQAVMGVTIPPEREMEPSIRMVSDKLERIQQLDKRPLVEARPPERRIGEHLS